MLSVYQLTSEIIQYYKNNWDDPNANESNFFKVIQKMQW